MQENPAQNKQLKDSMRETLSKMSVGDCLTFERWQREGIYSIASSAGVKVKTRLNEDDRTKVDIWRVA